VTVLPQDDGTMTELIEPSGAVSPSELTAMRELLTREMGAFGGVALSGSLPPGVPDSFYADVATLALDRALVLLDAWSKVAVPALEAGVSVLKINVHELAELTGCTDLEEGTRACLERYPVQAVAVTCGPDPAVLVTRRTAWRVPVPEATHVVSPLGAGDVVAGVMLHDLVSGTAADPRSREWDQRVLRAFALGLGCASASAQTASPSEFDPALGRGLAIAALEGAEVLRQ
jgi:fructose-1-phosphate kinase PfkB-like protein